MPLLAAQPSFFPETLFTSDVPEAVPDWLVLCTRAQGEKALARSLHARGVGYFLPLHERRWLTPSGRMRCSYLPLFPGYVFLHGATEPRWYALQTGMISRCLTVVDQLALHRDLVRVYRLICSGASLLPEERLEPGSLVEIVCGSLAGLQGKMIRRDEQLRLVIEVELLQRGVSVEIDSHMVQPLGKPPDPALSGIKTDEGPSHFETANLLAHELEDPNGLILSPSVSQITPLRSTPKPDTNAGMRYVQHVFHAAGGLGEVYKAQDAELGRQVALKRMKRDVARHAESRRRFLREAEITGRLEHPGIVPVYGLVKDQDGQPCYAMRFIEGESLKDAIVRFHRRRAQPADNPMSAGEETLEFRKLLNHFIAACNTIAYAHCRGILHRDLKPDNIMLGPYGETLVVDWGLAKVVAGEANAHRWLAAFDVAQLPIVSPLELGVNLDTDASGDERKPESKKKSSSETVNEEAIADFLLAQGDRHDKDSGAERTDKNAAKLAYAFVDKGSSELTQPGRAIGTLAFMSPEQAAGRLDLMGPASDVYSLGATLYFLLTGKPPFSESDGGKILQEVVEEPFYPARQNRHVPRALEAICSKAMRLKPEDRYPSAGALAGDIEHWLADEPVSAWREPISLQIKRWVRRHTALVTAAASLLVTATIGLAVGIVLLNEKQRITEDARQQAIEKLELGETLAGMMRLANSYAEAGSTDESIKLREETFQLVKTKLGNEPYRLQSMKSLAMSYYSAGRTQEALKLGEETLQLVKTKHGPDDPETLSSMNDLGIFYAAVGRNQQALKLREETLQLRRAKLGPDHPDTLVSMNNLAKSYHTAGRTQEAIKLQEETLQLRKARLSPEHYDTLFSMNNLANSYIAEGAVGKALAILQDALALRERRVKAEPGNSVERSFLAWTHGQMGETEQARLDYGAAAQAYARSVEMFEKLDQARPVTYPLFHERLTDYRQRLALCRKAEQAVKDLDFALQQPATEVPALLRMRVRYLLKQQKLAEAVESAAKMKELAGDKADQFFDAACAYALCAGAAKQAKSLVDGAPSSEKLADEALAFLQQAVAKGYKNAAHMKRDKDLDALRDRADFQMLLGELEAAKKD